MSAAPEQVGPYTVLRRLGQGGMGTVYAVRDPDLPRELALKRVEAPDADPDSLERFWREAEALARVKHPHVVTVHSLGRAEEGPYLVMDLVEGEPLGGSAQPAREAARIVRALCGAVEAVHGEGILHRDLKPGNVMLKPDGSPVLLDFGLARDATRERLTATGTTLGTPAYMSPEQAGGISTTQLDERVDVYGLGVILYALLCGRAPFSGPLINVLRQVCFEEPVWPAALEESVPVELDAICRRAMAKEPAQRYPSAAALGDDLDRFLAGERPQAMDAAGPRRGQLLAALVLVLGLLGGLAWVLHDPTLSPAEASAEALALAKDGWGLLREGRALEGDAAAIEALGARLERLERQAPPELDAKAQGKARRRVLALQGLLALARGQHEHALQVFVRLGEQGSPAGSALRGALAATSPTSEPEGAARDLSRAISRGVARPELRYWRAHARVREGLVGVRQAEEALGDLDVFAARGQALPGAQPRTLRVTVLLRLGRLAEAGQLVQGWAGAPAGVRWRFALASAQARLAKDPAEALRLLEGVPVPEGSPSAEARALAKQALEHAATLLPALGRREFTAAQERRLAALLRIHGRALPKQSLPPALLEQALLGSTNAQGPARVAVMLALTELAPDDYQVQRQVGTSIQRGSKIPKQQRARFLKPLRRAIALAPTAKARTDLTFVLCVSLPDHDRLRECVELATALLPQLAGDRYKRAAVFAARSRARFELKELEPSLSDVDAALKLLPSSRHRTQRARVLVQLNREREALDESMRAIEATTGGDSERLDRTVGLAWKLAIALKDYARGRQAVERLVAARPKLWVWWLRLAHLRLLTRAPAGARQALVRAESLVRKVPGQGRVAARVAAQLAARQLTIPALEALVKELEPPRDR